ncbi:hypothetical protein CTM61_06635 [Prevotella intermedia]|nr:hypothetical protein CTM61_06635 [Prevotella intermedia]
MLLSINQPLCGGVVNIIIIFYKRKCTLKILLARFNKLKVSLSKQMFGFSIELLYPQYNIVVLRV